MEVVNITKERKNIVFYSDKDSAILKHLNRQKNQGAYIKSLIKEDMKKSKKSNDIDSILNSNSFEKKINSIIEKKVQEEVNKYINIVNKCYNTMNENND